MGLRKSAVGKNCAGNGLLHAIVEIPVSVCQYATDVCMRMQAVKPKLPKEQL